MTSGISSETHPAQGALYRETLVKGDIVQINTSAGGLPKHPVGAASVHALGIHGDIQRNRQYHGGPQQALLLVSSEAVDQLRCEGWPVFYGALGENLTTRGLDHRAWRSGQRFRAGSIVLELTTPRKPCQSLDAYGAGIQKRLYEAKINHGDASSPLWGIGGFYASVIQTGNIQLLDIIELVEISR